MWYQIEVAFWSVLQAAVAAGALGALVWLAGGPALEMIENLSIF